MPARTSSPSIVFRVAGGPRLGFGHLVRAVSLAKAMDVTPRLSIRGTRETMRVARRLGAIVDAGELSVVLREPDVALLVIDDPDTRAARAALAIARRHRVPVASVHDLGLAAIASDLAIDGSLPQPRRSWPAEDTLRGARYAVLDPALLETDRAARGTDDMRRVVVSLGGGRRLDVAMRTARAIAEAHPHAQVVLAAGFVARTVATDVGDRVQVLETPATFRRELAQADVAVLAGGVTLYEAAAFGVPSVAVAVVDAQRPTVRAFDRCRAAIVAGSLQSSPSARSARTIARIVDAVGLLLENAPLRRRMSAAGRKQIDGRGAQRVAAAMWRLIDRRLRTAEQGRAA